MGRESGPVAARARGLTGACGQTAQSCAVGAGAQQATRQPRGRQARAQREPRGPRPGPRLTRAAAGCSPGGGRCTGSARRPAVGPSPPAALPRLQHKARKPDQWPAQHRIQATMAERESGRCSRKLGGEVSPTRAPAGSRRSATSVPRGGRWTRRRASLGNPRRVSTGWRLSWVWRAGRTVRRGSAGPQGKAET